MLYTVRDGQIVELATGRTISLDEETERLDQMDNSERYDPLALNRMVDRVVQESRSQNARGW